ncbi:MAG: sodium/glutamate symporter [Peptoniphilaceae bacterium]|nr:sodium/glutamate symporter [Peptoniphilaceae bacterium]MDY6019170.1 sodium/glutamate symporter [Anaerococcus sp.]
MVIEFDVLQTVGLSVLAYLFGSKIKEKVKFFQKFFIPSPVIGGLIFSILVFLFNKFGLVEIKFDTSMQDFFMNMFFTCIGFTCSIKLLKKSGFLGLKLALAIILFLFVQNLIGVGLASLLGINKLLGIAMGSISMTGGIGSAVSFGPIMEGYGAKLATEIGVAAATCGLMMGSLVGGPVATVLIKKYALKPKFLDKDFVNNAKDFIKLDQKSLMTTSFLILLAAFLGTYINKVLVLTGLNFPYYVGCQFGGLVVRNICDIRNSKNLRMEEVNILGNISLALFLSIALISLNIEKIASLALPMLVVMLAQAIAMALWARFVTFNLSNKDYDAAVIAAGHCGVGLGQTPNAMANMAAVIEENGPAPIAMFVFPIVLAIAVNLTNPIIITFFINTFR